QLSQREKAKATAVFVPKVRKQRMSALDRPVREMGEDGKPVYRGRVAKNTEAKKPAPRKPANRRVRQTSDLPVATTKKR
ncbi:MAG: 23S rRNA pseudouridylate synthase B, partial [Methylotenera sp.]